MRGRTGWRGVVVLALGVMASGCPGGRGEAPFEPYLVVWAGDADRKDADFLAVVNANPSSRKYGRVLATVPVRSRGNEPQELNDTFRYDGRVFASGALGNRVFTFDLRDPEAPKLAGVTELGDRRYWAPRGIASLPSGRVAVACPDRARHLGLPREITGAPGGLVELDANGRLVREVSAGSEDSRGYVVAPSGATIAPAAKTLVTTSHGHGYAVSAQGQPVPGITVQLWKTSNLSLKRTLVLDAGPRGEENLGPITPRAMRRRPTVYVNTHEGGALYVSDSLGIDDPAFQLAFDFGADSFPVGAAVTPNDRFYVTALSGKNQVVVLDLADAMRPRLVSSVRLDRDPDPDGKGGQRAGGPGGLAMASDGSRIAVADYTVDVPTYRRDGDHRLYMLRLDAEAGQLRVDTAFRDETTDEVGLDFNRAKWPHGATGPARPRGLLFVAAPPAE
jgi:DNA-binding beta-propeller fold protein YncE